MLNTCLAGLLLHNARDLVAAVQGPSMQVGVYLAGLLLQGDRPSFCNTNP